MLPVELLAKLLKLEILVEVPEIVIFAALEAKRLLFEMVPPLMIKDCTLPAMTPALLFVILPLDIVILPVELFAKLPLFVMTVDVPEIERLVPFKPKFDKPLRVNAPPEIEIFATLLANKP